MPEYRIKRPIFYLMVICTVIFSSVILRFFIDNIAIMMHPTDVLPPAQQVQQHRSPYHGVATYVLHHKPLSAQAKKQAHHLGYPVHLIHITPPNKDNIDHHAFETLFEEYSPTPYDSDYYFAWMRSLKDFLHGSQQYAVLYEASAQFKPKALHRLVTGLIQHHDKWDIVDLEKKRRALSGNTEVALKAQQQVLLWPNSNRHIFDHTYNAVLLNRHAAQKLLSRALPMTVPLKFYIPIDWIHHVQTAALRPGLVVTRNETKFNYQFVDLKDNKKYHWMYTWTQFKRRLFGHPKT